MPMTKREQADMQALRDELALVRALRWTEAVEPDVPPPTPLAPYGTRTTGWIPVGGGSVAGRIEEACSSFGAHGVGPDNRLNSQGAISLYSTRLLALRGLRHQVETHVAGILACIDHMIASEQAGNKGGN